MIVLGNLLNFRNLILVGFEYRLFKYRHDIMSFYRDIEFEN